MCSSIFKRNKSFFLIIFLSVFVISNTELSSKEPHIRPLFNGVYFINVYSLFPFYYLQLSELLEDALIAQNLEIGRDTSDFEKPSLFRYEERQLFQNEWNLFKYEDIRRNSPYKYQFGQYLQNEISGYESQLLIDSNARKVYSNEYIDSVEISYPYEMSLDEYLTMRQRSLRLGIWDSMLTSYDLNRALSGGDIARLISQATGISIPIPPNPLMGIFGKPEISINVSGEVNIRMGFRWDSQNLGTVSALGQSQATPMFSQDIRVNVSGRIGDKFQLGTDWNTNRTFDYQNKFKLGYEGYDDDIIKLVEVGNVSLPLQTSLIRGGEALFGARVDMQFGPLYLKTLFSQKRGERRFVDVRGGTSKQPFQLRAYDYARNHFFLDTAYKNVYRDYFASNTPVIPAHASHLRVKEIEVWETTNMLTDIHSAEAVAFADLEPKRLRLRPVPERYDNSLKNSMIQTGRVERGRFIRLDSSRYNVDLNLGTLTIYNLRQDRTYAVAYRIEGETPEPEDDLYYGTLSAGSETKDTLILKLVYVPNLQPQYKSLWNRQMKNKYSINATNVNLAETSIGVWYLTQNNDSTDILEGAPDKLVTILKVDQVNNGTGSPPPDGQFDLIWPYFDAFRGEITFPHPEPFRGQLIEYFEKLGNPDLAYNYIFSEVYDTTYDVARRNTARDRFIISGEVSGRATNRISLGAFNLAPNSVRVLLDGRELREFEDYIVDYYTGTLTLRNPRAMLPNADLKIEYEQHDVFNISTRTLAGIRGDYILHRSRKADAMLGFTAMHYDQSIVTDRVRLGDEPVSNSIVGFDGRFNWDAQWITEALDWLPFYDTKAPSSLSVRGEMAMIIPEPNKRYSDIASDNGEPVVYIDDFEGAQRNISLGLNPNQWQHSSQPVDSSIAPNDSIAALFRGKTFWWQFFIGRVPIKEVYPNRSITTGHSNFAPLEIRFAPDIRGIYNRNPEFLDSLNPMFDPFNQFSKKPENRQRIWGGFMKLFSTFNTNFDTENIEYIEIMMRILPPFDGPDKTKMYIDIGQISEDIIPNGYLDTEDGSGENPIPNGIIDVGEDRGIDRLFDEEERTTGFYPYPLNLEKDPARDNYEFNFFVEDQKRREDGYDFVNYNNFEGNALVSETGQFPDTEILNRNNGQTIALANDYFSYEIVLDNNPATNPQIVGGGNNGWFLWRIPIRKPTRVVGNPSYSNIQYIRVWFKGGDLRLQIADWKLVGTLWQRVHNLDNVPPSDSVMQISFVNREEHSGPPDYYTLPPGVRPPKMIGSDDQTREFYLNEQSLSLGVRNLRYADERMAVRFFRPMDIFYYKKLKFFIHGDGAMPDAYQPGTIPRAEAFIRFGIDSSNYYEYRRPLLRGWQDINIELSDLTAIKERRDSLLIYERQEFPVPGDPGAKFIIKGNPILTKVQFFGVGIANPKERFPNELTTTMWVNELRLISPEKRTGWGGVGNIDIRLADLGQVNFAYQHTQPNFHNLEERFGNRINNTNWTFSVQAGLEKFAPKSFRQMKVPITYTHAEYIQDPEFVANNDINLARAAEAKRQQLLNDGRTQKEAEEAASAVRTRSQTIRVMDSWALTGVQLGLPIQHWLIRETINRMSFGYSYSQEFERSPVVEERFRWIWKLNSQYSVTLPKILEFEPLKWANEVPLIDTYKGLKINLLPSNVGLGLSMQRSRTTEQSRFLSTPSPIFRDFSALRQGQFSWRIAENGFINPTIDYSVNSGSTLLRLEFDEQGRQLTGSEISRRMFFQKGGLVDFGDDNNHTQTFVLNILPRLPNIGGINNYIDMSGSFNTTYNWTNPMQPDPRIRDIAKNASFSNSIRLGMGIRLKSAADYWWGVPDRRTGGIQQSMPDTSAVGSGIFSAIGRIFKTIFLDYEKIQIDFNQQNSARNPGVFGGTGMNNFWGRGLLFRSSEEIYGPSLAYQLGLISNPHGSFRVVPSASFPFFGFETFTGRRPPNAVLQDNFNQQSNLTISTNRPLWPGAVLDLRWTSIYAFNKNQTVITEEDGIPRFTNIIAMESYTRSYLAFPSFLGINLGGDIEDVVDNYRQKELEIEQLDLDDIAKNRAKQNALSESFHETLEAISIFKGQVGKFLPAVNWELRWDGLEKWDIWSSIIKRASLQHRYQSQYQETAQLTDNGRIVTQQQINYGFQPLIQITLGFDEKKLDGQLTSTIRYNTTTTYQLQSSNRSLIQRQSTEEFTIQANYLLRGWEFPLLGFKFKNDLEFSLMSSVKLNKRHTYDILDDESFQGPGNPGRTLDGNTQILIEPRARYSISNRLTAAFFIRYEGTFTEGAAQPGFSTTQVGLDIRLSIAGGR